MPPRKSMESALTSLITSAVRGAVREDIAGLRREVRKLQRRVERAGTGATRVRTGKGKPGRKPKFLVCQVEGCKGKPVAWGFCQTHYNRFKYRGDLKALAARVAAGEQIRDAARGEAPGKARGKVGRKGRAPVARKARRSKASVRGRAARGRTKARRR